MATRFYLPSTGTAPLASLAVDSQWELSDNLERRPCDVIKSNTSLTQKSANWTSASTQQWVWVQFQSKRLAAGYSWTTSDTVSMVIKVAEAAAQVDSHLCYVIRVVSSDGGTIRGTVGSYLTTSTEYPTSLASIATRIHDARTTGASNFSSQAGDRIIIEIGHHGVTPTLNTVYHNYGDPSATSDYALTADLTTDLCPWVELSRDVDFNVRATKSSYMKGVSTSTSTPLPAYTQGQNVQYLASGIYHSYLHGKADVTPDNQNAYTQGLVLATPDNQSAFICGGITILDNQNGYLKGKEDATPDNQNAYIQGKLDATPDSQSAYLKGSTVILDNQNVYTHGLLSIIDNQNVYTHGKLDATPDNQIAYTHGKLEATPDNQIAFVQGGIFASGILHSYTEGYLAGGSTSTSKIVFTLGLDNGLVPNNDLSSSGVWWNELNNTNNLYQSIDEYPTADDNDYIWDTNPITGNYYECALTNPPGIPASGEVVVFWRGKDITNLGIMAAKVELRQGSTIISSKVEKLTSTPTTFYLQISQAERDSITDWNDLRVRILPVYGRLSMKVWVRDLRTKAACDAFLNYVIGRYTDVAIFNIDDGVNPKEWAGTSTMGTSSTAVVDGKTPWAYLYDALHAAGIRVTAWIWITHFAYWGSPSGVDLDIPDNSTYNDAGIYNFHNATARQVMIDEIKDFIDNNNVDGIVLNMEGTTSNITSEDITNFVKDIRKAIPKIEMAWHVGADVHDDITLKMSPISWLNNNYIDLIYLMAYYGSVTSKLHYLGTNGISAGDRRISAGLGAESNPAQPSDFRQRWVLHKEAGFHNYFHFVWKDNFDDDQGFRDATDDYLNDTLSAVQLPITKVSVIPADHLTITVDGVDETTNYSDVTDHLYSGPLKKHIETAVGHENPAIIYKRENSTSTEILIGDYEPDE